MTGVIRGLLENQKIKVGRQISQVETETQMHMNDVNTAKLKINDQLGYFEINAKLSVINSTLMPLTHGQVEVIQESVLKRSDSRFASAAPFFRQ